MVTHLRRNAVAYLALFVALSGTSYAAVQISANSIGSKQLRKGAVTKAKVARGAVTKVAIAKGSVTLSALAPGVAIAGPQGLKGDAGVAGAQGDTGATGPAGPTFAKGSQSGAGPSATPDVTLETTSIVTPTAGRLFVFGRGTYYETCASPSSVTFGLYLDGVAATGSGTSTSSGTTVELSTWGLTGVLAAGTHTLTLAGDCTTAGVSFSTAFSGGSRALGAILVGG
jgi:hypothetical protein